ncbi:tetratricopeptide repeat protein, partial [Chloroflexota bacterium]
MTFKRLSGIVVNMNLKTLISGLLLATFIASCKMPADVPESGLPLAPKPSQTATVPPIPSPTPTQTPAPTPIPSARIESGDHALFIGDWEKALVEYQTAFDASSDPDVQSAALLGIGRAWLLARNYFEATNVLEDLIQNYPDSAHIPEANLTLGHAHQAQEHYSEAADAYLNYLVLRPGVIDGYVLNLRADALFAAGDYGGAALDYQAAAQSPSLLDSIVLQMKTARALAISREYQNALALYDEIFSQTDDDDTRALINLRKGQIYSSLGETELAWTAYLDAVENYPKSYNSYSALIDLVDAGAPVDELERGIVDYYAGQYGVALSALDRYLQNDPADPA